MAQPPQHRPDLPHSLPLGTVLSQRYRIEGVLEASSVLETYTAIQIGLGQPVVVQLVRAGVQPTSIDAYMADVRAAAAVRHEGIDRAMDHGVTDGGEPFIVKEAVRGMTLGHALGSGPLDPRRATALFINGLDALQAAHEQGLLHGALCPERFFIVEPGSRAEALRLTGFGRLHLLAPVGGGRWRPPEAAPGARPAPAWDVYQSALVLAHALTGLAPETLKAQGLSMNLGPRPLVTVLARALESNPAARWRDAGALRDALEGVEVALATMTPQRPSGPLLSPSMLRNTDAAPATVEQRPPALKRTVEIPREGASGGGLRRMASPGEFVEEDGATVVDDSPLSMLMGPGGLLSSASAPKARPATVRMDDIDLNARGMKATQLNPSLDGLSPPWDDAPESFEPPSLDDLAPVGSVDLRDPVEAAPPVTPPVAATLSPPPPLTPPSPMPAAPVSVAPATSPAPTPPPQAAPAQGFVLRHLPLLLALAFLLMLLMLALVGLLVLLLGRA